MMRTASAVIGLALIVAIEASFSVPRVDVLGNQTDPFAEIRPNRDGGSVGTINGKIVWFYSDTDYTVNGTLRGFYGNTAAIGQPNNPLVVVGPAREAIPYTSEEDAFNKNHSYSPRYTFVMIG